MGIRAGGPYQNMDGPGYEDQRKSPVDHLPKAAHDSCPFEASFFMKSLGLGKAQAILVFPLPGSARRIDRDSPAQGSK